MKATPANMVRVLKQHGQRISVPGVFAYSPETGEQSSASPGDYWLLDPNECLTDSEGNEMILAREVTRIVPVRRRAAR